jgi:hypothetical protein
MKRQVPLVDGDGRDAETGAADPGLLTLSTGPGGLPFRVVIVTDASPSMMVDGTMSRHHRASPPIMSGNERTAAIRLTHANGQCLCARHRILKAAGREGVEDGGEEAGRTSMAVNAACAVVHVAALTRW